VANVLEVLKKGQAVDIYGEHILVTFLVFCVENSSDI